MKIRVLVFVVAALAVLAPHLTALAVMTVIAGAIAVLGIEILTVTRQTGWGLVPCRAARAGGAGAW